MSLIEKIKTLHSEPAGETNLTGMQSFNKVFSKDDSTPAFFSISKLDLDTDGKKDPNIHYESTHQDVTSIDPHGDWLNSNTLNFYVLPGNFTKRHGGIKTGCLGTVIYGDKFAHAIFADVGPKTKYGEASIHVHRTLGFERVKNGHILDCGIDNNVGILIYINSVIPHTPCTQSDIDEACKEHWEKFNS